MFKKVIIGTLATGIMLSGAGGVFAETPTDTGVKLKRLIIKSFVKKKKNKTFLVTNQKGKYLL